VALVAQAAQVMVDRTNCLATRGAGHRAPHVGQIVNLRGIGNPARWSISEFHHMSAAGCQPAADCPPRVNPNHDELVYTGNARSG
jgi:hypothetical protein